MAEVRLDLVFLGGTVVPGAGRRRVDLGIRDGRVAAVAPPGTLGAARQSVAADGMLLLPGIVDTHFHCRAPDHPEREDFDSGTAAAAAGGVTTLLEMPISDPACATPEVVASRIALAREQIRVDVGFYAGPGDLDVPRLREMMDAGAIAFKMMMHGYPPGRASSFAGLSFIDDRDVFRALELVATTGRVIAVHAEDQGIIDVFESRQRAVGAMGPVAHARSRPDIAESLAIARLGAMNEVVSARVHIVHVSSARALEYIRWFRSRGQDMTAETTPLYLLANEREVDRYGPYLKVNPPLRSESDQRALRRGLLEGTLDMIVSDHSPFLAPEKEAGWMDIWGVGSGVPGVELTGPLLWDDALSGRGSMEQVVAWTSERPAEVFGLSRRKGHLRVGADADVIVFDPAASIVLAPATFHSRSAGAIRHVSGRPCRGAIVSVWSRGRLAFADGRVTADRGSGRVLRHDPVSPEVGAPTDQVPDFTP